MRVDGSTIVDLTAVEVWDCRLRDVGRAGVVWRGPLSHSWSFAETWKLVSYCIM